MPGGTTDYSTIIYQEIHNKLLAYWHCMKSTLKQKKRGLSLKCHNMYSGHIQKCTKTCCKANLWTADKEQTHPGQT